MKNYDFSHKGAGNKPTTIISVENGKVIKEKVNGIGSTSVPAEKIRPQKKVTQPGKQ